MKTLNPINPMRVSLKHSALAIAAVAALGIGTAQAAPPANDNFAAAIDLTGSGSGQTGTATAGTQTGTTTIDATFEAGEPECFYPEATNTVWFKWICATSGGLGIKTTGSTNPSAGEWDSVVGIYTGASLGALSPLPGTPQDSGADETLNIAVTAGTTYYIQLAGDSGAPPQDATNILLTWTFVLPVTVDVAGYITNPNSEIGVGSTANMTAAATFGWQTNNCAIPVITNGFLFTLENGGGNPLNYTGDISGLGGLELFGWGANPIRLGGGVGNTYGGTTTVNGNVHLEKAAGDALRGAITVKASSSLVWTAANQLNDASDVTLATGASLNLAGFADTINELSLVTGSSVSTGVGGILKVAKLFINGIQQPEVAYVAGDGYVLGSGYIEVGASGPPVILTPPAVPATPAPADLATTVHPANLPKLDWADSSLATSYDVYFWLAADPKPVTANANVALSEFPVSPQVLSLSTYKWQVVAKNLQGDTAGPEWTFSTVDRTLVAGNFSVDYSSFTHNLNYIVGAGNSGILQGNFRVHWSGGQGSFSVPVDTNGFILDADTGGGNGGHVASGPISGTGSFVITHGPAGGAWDNIYTISGATANTYSGGTQLKRGTIKLIKTAGVDALPPGSGPITLGMAGDTARLVWGASDQVNDLVAINVLLPTVTVPAPDANLNFLDLAGFSDTIAALTLPDDGTKTQVRTGTSTGGTLTVTTLTVNGAVMPAGTYTAANSTFVFGLGSVVVPSSGTPYEIWATANAGGQSASEDFNNDGVSNGLAYFMGAAGTIAATTPPVIAGKVTWPRDPAATVSSFMVQVSDDLAIWTNVIPPDGPGIDTSVATEVTYTLPGGTKQFCRLVVTP
jgi:autotransporter-associated beta strand protein